MAFWVGKLIGRQQLFLQFNRMTHLGMSDSYALDV